MRRLTRGLVIFMAILLLVVIAAVGFSPSIRTAFKTVLFVAQIIPALTINPQDWFQPEPIRERITIPLATGLGQADIYRLPERETQAAVLLFFGVVAAGPDDERITNLGRSLARSGLVTMIYWSPAMMNGKLHGSEVDNLVHAFQYLRQKEFVDPERVGMGGFCVGASLALVAAADPRIRANVSFVNAFGPYYRMRDLTRALGSRTRVHEGSPHPWEIDDLAFTVFSGELIGAVEDPLEQEYLSRYVLGEAKESDYALDELTSEARAVLNLIKGVPIDKVEGYIDALPDSLLDHFDKISPSAHVENIQARVLVMHDIHDRMIPVDESQRLVQELPRKTETYYTEFSIFQHVDPTRRLGMFAMIKEIGSLFLHMYNVLWITA